MQETMEKSVHDVAVDEAVVLMYPDNQLKAQVRDYEDTFSVFTVLEETFFPERK